MARVRIGIVTWNSATTIGACLSALPVAAAGQDFDVVLVDNASGDPTVEVAARHGDVTIVGNRENLGYARAMNQALRHGTGPAPDVLIALNPDTVPLPGSLSYLVERLLGDASVGLVTPRLLYPDGGLQHSVYRFPSPVVTMAASLLPAAVRRGRIGERFWLEGAAAHLRPVDVDWAIGAVHVIRAAAVAGRDVYSERWFMYAEDLELCWDLAERGWRRRLEPDAAVVHVGNVSGEQAWGDDRARQWWPATYDWYELRHGRSATRRWAAVNTACAGLRLALLAPARRRGRQLAGWERDVGVALPLHVRAVRGGPRSP